MNLAQCFVFPGTIPGLAGSAATNPDPAVVHS